LLYASIAFAYLLRLMRIPSIQTRGRLATALVALVVFSCPALASGQLLLDADPGSSVRSRAELEELLGLYEEAIRSPAYSATVKQDLAEEADRIRSRLQDGDFKLGDRIVLSVQGEPTLPDTVAVEGGPKITLPLFGEISLRGVLRSEVEGRITEALSVFLRDPVVRAEGLMRVSVQGAVGAPGFYVVPADMLLSEALMTAGGPGQTAQLEDLRIERGVEVLMEGDALQEALRQGLSLDQLNLQAGDQVVVPAQAVGGGFWGRLSLIIGVASTLTFAVFQLVN
jgi:protein involved in polysaccharide export with SLBB domain